MSDTADRRVRSRNREQAAAFLAVLGAFVVASAQAVEAAFVIAVVVVCASEFDVCWLVVPFVVVAEKPVVYVAEAVKAGSLLVSVGVVSAAKFVSVLSGSLSLPDCSL